MSDWQYGSCPAISCPSGADLMVDWTNLGTGSGGPATHGVAPACHCPLFSQGYCYTACNHYWWASVPLGYGNNEIEIAATAPGFAPGSATALVQRVPVEPVWRTPVAGPGSITLDWEPVADATSYNLYWSTTPYGWSSLCAKIPSATRPFTHAVLASGVVHYYFVTALVDEAESFDSLRLAATPE